jgi:protein-tyrosine phosphatase
MSVSDDQYLEYRPEGDGKGIELDGVPNARGIGGYPTEDGHHLRDGLFFRTAGLNFLGAHGIGDLEDLGVKEVVDLRDPAEIEQWPYSLPADIHVDRVPLIKDDTVSRSGQLSGGSKGANRSGGKASNDGAVDMAKMYHDIVFGSADRIVSILKKLATPSGHPMLIHCTAGKDRTGITSAILMSLLGVDDDMVVSCYAQSGANLGEAFKKAVMAGLDDDSDGVGEVSAAQTALLASPPELIRDVLDDIKRQYGSVEEYCLKNGMTSDEVETLRTLFVE